MAITITIGITVLERNRPFGGITSYRGVTELLFSSPPPSGNFILLEDGSYILQEDGSKILLE